MKLLLGAIGLLLNLAVAIYIVSNTMLCDDTKFVCMDMIKTRHFVLAGVLFVATVLILITLMDKPE